MKITAFHASKNYIHQAHNGLTYFSPNPEYKYLKVLPHRHEAELDLTKSYWCEDINFIEALRARPDTVERLKTLGYNSVVYANPKNLLMGASGWGDDCAQIATLTGEPINYWIPVDSHEPLIQTYSPPKNLIGPLYHSTDALFIKYERGDNAGIHFGTKSAASDRARQTLRGIDVSICKIEATKIDFDRQKINSGNWPSGLLHDTYAILLNKLQSPPANLLTRLQGMSNDELTEIVSEYAPQRDQIAAFASSIQRAQQHGSYQVSVNSIDYAVVPSKAEAEWLKSAIKQQQLKSVYIYGGKLLNIEDGVFTPSAILQCLRNEEPKAKRFLDLSMQKETPDEIHQVMLDALTYFGYDAIRYQNEVEDPGSESYFVCDMHKIIPKAERLPRQPEIPEPQLPRDHLAEVRRCAP